MKQFTAQQKEIVARKLGYDGPMQGFDEYLMSNPVLESRYSMLTGAFAEKMAKGGMVKKYADGGVVPQQMQQDWNSYWDTAKTGEAIQWAGGTLTRNADGSATYTKSGGSPLTFTKDTPFATVASQVPDAATDWQKTYGYTPTTATAAPANKITATGIDLGGNLSDAPTITKASTPITAASSGASSASLTQAGTTATADLTKVAAPDTVSTPAPIVAPVAQAATSAEDVAKALEKLTPQQGAVSKQAKVTAVTKEPTTTAVSGLEAAQAKAAQVTGAPTRTVQEGEMVSGTAVDQARVAELMSQQQAAQGTVTAEMTVQGQLNQLLQNFDAGNPPPWAAATMRTATAQMAARGLSASSMAGQAIIQATLEAATPIAAADAKVFETMGLQNLSNRQQMAVLVAQQRAQFLGQEFDQAFQTRVLNAAKISDIANKNFDAQTQIALENARLANSTNLANLSAKNALVLAEAAAMSQLETQNLSNLQQAAVENARAFLQMDMKNLDNRQQVELFKAQSITNSLMQDASLQNAINITNATNALDAAKVSAQLKLTAETFNAGEKNKVALANANAANQLAQFNAQQKNARDQFNAEMANQISMANAKILADVSIANTAAANAAAIASAQNATQLTMAEYAQQSQTYRDMLEMSWKTGEAEKDRVTEIAKATLTASATTNAASTAANVSAATKIGALAFETVKNWSSVKAGVTDIGKTVSDWFGTTNTNVPGGSGWGLDLNDR